VPRGRTLAEAQVPVTMSVKRTTNRTNDVRGRIASPLLPRAWSRHVASSFERPASHERGNLRPAVSGPTIDGDSKALPTTWRPVGVRFQMPGLSVDVQVAVARTETSLHRRCMPEPELLHPYHRLVCRRYRA